MSKPFSYQDLLKPIVDGLAYYPSRISVFQHRDGPRVELFVKCHVDDVGLIVGKQGKTVKAIQELFRFIGERQGDKVGIAVRGEGNSEKSGIVHFADRSWDKTPVLVSIFVNCVEAMGFDIAVDSEEYHDKTLLMVRSKAPKELTRSVDWILKMIACHCGRKITVDWK